MYKVEIIDGYKEYIKNKEKISVLENINVKFEACKVYAIMGNSGEGKTTLLNIIGTLDTLTSGKLIIDNEEVGNLKDKEKAYLRMKKIGFIFQEFYLNKNMTVEENIMQPMYVNEKYNKKSIAERADYLIDVVGLSKRKKHFPRELSGGEQQRVAIARAIANEPDIILADEPTGNLDKDNQNKIFEILKALSKGGKCVIIVSHTSKIKEYADVVLKLEEGNLKIDEDK